MTSRVFAAIVIGTIASHAAADPQRPVKRETATITLLRKLQSALETDDGGLPAIEALVGSTAKPGVKPTAKQLAAVRVVRADSNGYRGAIYLLEVTFAPGASPTFDELAQAFGAGDSGGVALHGERETLYRPRTSHAHWRVALIAEQPHCFDPHSSEDPPPCDPDAPIESIRFRRDPVLP
jgi:hypothetical protein